MATRYLSELPFRVAPDLVGAPLASPSRRLLAFVLDIAVMALPTLAVTFFAATLWLRSTDRPAFKALRTFSDPQASAGDRQRAGPDLARLLVQIDAPGVPPAAVVAVESGRLTDAAEIVMEKELLISLTAGTRKEATAPGQILLPLERLIPKVARGVVIYALQALYFTILTSLFGATLGKRLTGIRVRSLEGEDVSLPEAFERFVGYVHIPALLFWPLVYLWKDPNRQLPHDRAARTVVVRAPRRSERARTPSDREGGGNAERPGQEASERPDPERRAEPVVSASEEDDAGSS